MNQPDISVITIVYNGEDVIEETILSVLQQADVNVEYIIIDGQSTDGTVEIVKKYLSDIDHFVSEKDYGISDAFNKGLKLATGKYINILNAGDVFANPQTLSSIRSDLNYDIVSFAHSSFNDREKISKPIDSQNVFTRRALINHQATFVLKTVYDRFGGYSLSYKIRMDYDFFLRVLPRTQLKYIHKIVVHYQAGVSGAVKNKIRYELEGITAEYLNLRKSNTYILRMLYIPIINLSKYLLILLRDKIRGFA